MLDAVAVDHVERLHPITPLRFGAIQRDIRHIHQLFQRFHLIHRQAGNADADGDFQRLLAFRLQLRLLHQPAQMFPQRHALRRQRAREALNGAIRGGQYDRVLNRWGESVERLAQSEINPPGLGD